MYESCMFQLVMDTELGFLFLTTVCCVNREMKYMLCNCTLYLQPKSITDLMALH